MNRSQRPILTLVLGGVVVGALSMVTGSDFGRPRKWQIGLDISPVALPTDLSLRERRRIGFGSYLVNAVAACTWCHSCPTYQSGENPFDGVGSGLANMEGHMAGGVPLTGVFGDTIVSPNLTPDALGLPGGLNLNEFLDAMHLGARVGTGVLEAMPWPEYRHMTDRDLKRIYEYLAAIPSAPTPPAGACLGPGQ